MDWTFSAGRWILNAPTGRTALIAPTSESVSADVELYASNPAHEVKVCRLSSGDGRWCLEVGIESSNWVIRPVVAGVPQSSVTNATGDIPDGAVACQVAHGLSAGNQVIRMRVRLVEGRISLYVNGEEDPTLSHALTADELEDFGRNRHWGFASDVSLAKVSGPQISTLRANVLPRRDALVGACGGGVYVSLDENGPRLVADGVFPPDAEVSMVAYQQVVYMLGGGRALKMPMATLVIAPWGEASGAGVLPGALEVEGSSPTTYVPGTSRMTTLYNAGDRIGMFGDQQDPQNAFECAIGNAADWDTGDVDAPGRAFALTNELAGRVGEPIIAAGELDGNTRIFACRNSIWRMLGDPALGVARLERVESAYGASGKDALAPVSSGTVMVHAPEGVFAVGSGGPAVPISLDDLTEGLTIPRSDIDSYYVQMHRDPQRQLVDVYLTPVEEPAEDFSIWFSLCERSRRVRGNGWWAMTLPGSMGPTASCVWNGKTVIGTRDGFLLVKNDASKNDNGEGIDANIPIILTVDGGRPDPDHEVVLSRLGFEFGVETQTAAASDEVSCTVYGGLTVEMAYAGTERWLLIGEFTAPDMTCPVSRRVRAPSIVAELSNGADPDRAIRVESVWAETSLSARLVRRKPVAVTRPTPTRPSDDLSFPGETTPDAPTPGPGSTSGVFLEAAMATGGSDGGLMVGGEFQPIAVLPPPAGGGGGGGPVSTDDVVDAGGISGGPSAPGAGDGEWGGGVGGSPGDVAPW